MYTSKVERIVIQILVSITIIFIVLLLWGRFTHTGRAITNLWFGSVQIVDDKTNYETRKKVEDTCRAMITSYEADKLTYEQYKYGGTAETQSWAAQARLRCNKTATAYNNYILKNSYVWEDNIPKDIRKELEYIQEVMPK